MFPQAIKFNSLTLSTVGCN